MGLIFADRIPVIKDNLPDFLTKEVETRFSEGKKPSRLLERAMKGDINSQLTIAQRLSNSKGHENYFEAVKWYKFVAENRYEASEQKYYDGVSKTEILMTGRQYAQFLLAKIYENGGHGVNPNIEESAKWYEISGFHSKSRQLLGFEKEVPGFKCPRCDNIAPIDEMPCENCGCQITIVDEKGKTGLNELFPPIYRTWRQYCGKCGKVYDGGYCGKCGTECSLSNNYGIHIIPLEKFPFR